MRLLLVTKDFPPQVGSIPTWSFELGKRFAARCDDFALVAPRVPGHVTVDRAAPFDVIRVPCTPGTFAGAVALGLGALCSRRRFDTLLGAQWQSSLPGLLWRDRGGPRRVFAAVHGREIFVQQYRALPFAPMLYGAAREQVLGRVDGVFPVSHYARDLVARLGTRVDHAEVVTNGCNAERFQPAPPSGLARELGLSGRRVLLSVGRLVSRKGVDNVLFALSALGVQYPDLRYVIAGDGPERQRLELLAERLRISHRVRFLGHVDEETLPRIYHLCDIFVHATRQEAGDVDSAGLVLLEANASGKPVVATACGGVGDAVFHEQTGLLTPPDDVPALATAIARLLDNPALGRQLGDGGRTRVLGHATWERVAERLLRSMSEVRVRRGLAVPRAVPSLSSEQPALL